MTATYTITNDTWEWAREALTNEIELLLDDPSILEEEPERVDQIKAVALDLDLDLMGIIKTYGTAYEVDRLLPYFEKADDTE